MSDPLSRMVGGDHYTAMGIQPIQITMANGYDPCTFSVFKYVSRHNTSKGKGVEDLEKAFHFVELRLPLILFESRAVVSERVRIVDYSDSNKMCDRQFAILRNTHRWASGAHAETDAQMALAIGNQIRLLIEHEYPR